MIEGVRKRNLETGEAMITSVSPKWFGGFFEGGCWLGFDISERKSHKYAYPRARLGEKNIYKLQTLAKILGGVVGQSRDHKRDEIENFWTLSNSALAVCMADHMRKYAPSHQETILAFDNWNNTFDPEERVAIAYSSREVKRPVLTVEDYLPLVENAAFLAGVIDNRGFVNHAEHMYDDKSFGNITLQIALKSTNAALLEALQKVWGGSFNQVTKKGDLLIINGRTQILTHDSFKWTVGIQPKSKIVKGLEGQIKLLKI